MEKVFFTLIALLWLLLSIWWFGFALTDFSKGVHPFWVWCGLLAFVVIVWGMITMLALAIFGRFLEDAE